MAQPGRRGQQGTAAAITKAVAGGWAGLRPTAGRQAPVSWQQVNTERPRPPRRAPPGVCAHRPPAPASPAPQPARGALVRDAQPATSLRWVPQRVVAAAQWLTAPSPRRAPLSASASSRRAAGAGS